MINPSQLYTPEKQDDLIKNGIIEFAITGYMAPSGIFTGCAGNIYISKRAALKASPDTSDIYTLDREGSLEFCMCRAVDMLLVSNKGLPADHSDSDIAKALSAENHKYMKDNGTVLMLIAGPSANGNFTITEQPFCTKTGSYGTPSIEHFRRTADQAARSFLISSKYLTETPIPQ